MTERSKGKASQVFFFFLFFLGLSFFFFLKFGCIRIPMKIILVVYSGTKWGLKSEEKKKRCRFIFNCDYFFFLFGLFFYGTN